jgi:hypothetical protein
MKAYHWSLFHLYHVFSVKQNVISFVFNTEIQCDEPRIFCYTQWAVVTLAINQN